MFPRRTVVTSHGSHYEYVHLVESVRRESDGRPVHKVIANLGPMDDVAFNNLKAAMAASRAGKRVAVVTATDSHRPSKPDANLRYLDIAVACELWRHWGLEQVLRDIMPRDERDVAAEKVVEILTIQRLIAPGSKLAAVRWFPHTALPELLGIAPRRLNNTRIHRVLDELEMATPALMAKLPRLYRERHGAFVSLFMDVTDTWFVGHGPDVAVRSKTKEGMVQRKIGIVLMCNERGYPVRWEVIPGNRNDSPAMTAMVQAISGLDWVGEAPVVLDRAMGKSAHLRDLVATKLRFLTALTRTEFSTYATDLPWKALEDLSLRDGDVSELAAKAAQAIESAGMKKVDDKLLVLDVGVVEPVGTEQTEPLPDELSPQMPSTDEPNAQAMRLCRQLRQAVLDGRYSSHAAVGAAFGLKKSVFYKYRQLLGLAEDIQQRIADGEAAGWPLAKLIDIAKLEDPEAQRAAFEVLLQSTPTERVTVPLLGPRRSSTSAEQGQTEPFRVRVVAYFNPERFAEQRQSAVALLSRIASFVTDLNAQLAGPRSKRSREKILAAIDRRLHKEEVLEAFRVHVETREIEGLSRYQVELELDEAEWRRRRRYDGFSVLVGHAALPHTAAELCQLYRAKDMVEKDFQVIKSVVELRPVRHRTDLKVSAHVTLCMLALLLERTLREKLAGKYTVGQALEHLERCRLNRYPRGNGVGVYSITAVDKEQRSLLRTLRLPHLAEDDHLAARITPR